MGRFTTGRVLVLGAFLFLLAAHPIMAQQGLWFWTDGRGHTRTSSDLFGILTEHGLWRRYEGKSGKQADLSGAHMIGANLTEADLTDANLTRADLPHAVLRGTNLSFANLTRANLSWANLTGAYLTRSNLAEADLTDANLTGADLTGADLTRADLTDADLRQAIFEPMVNPEIRGIARALNLELMTYSENPDALAELRRKFQDGGFQEQERKITYSIKRREAELAWDGCKSRKSGYRAIVWSSDSNLANCGSFVLNRVFFDWTCQYGMSPGRPLSIGVLLWMLCSVLYFVCIHTSWQAGLYRVYAQGIQEDSLGARRVERILPASKSQTRGVRRFLQFLRQEWLVLRASMFFSLMSAFNIGFRDMNFGRWLRLLTRQEFDIKAVGWARVVAGWQSLVSVYLIALWVLTYFGRPFG